MAVRYLANKWTVRYLLVVLMVIMAVEAMSGKVNLSGERDQEIELRLKQLNKAALKSIESSGGEIIDCIPIANQPAFDHPMLQNHTIQMTPSSYPQEIITEEDIASAPSNDEELSLGNWQEIALKILFPSEEQQKKIFEEKIILRLTGKKLPHQFYHPTATGGYEDHEYAITYVDNGVFRGAKAQINVWKPRIQEAREFSVSQIWVVGGRFGPGLNTLEAGSHSDCYQKTGCYNLLCSGFVQINKRISLGATLKPISTYNGPQYLMIVQIWKVGFVK
ncbi:unnamed protein product, partial [Thlaspi arvense]